MNNTTGHTANYAEELRKADMNQLVETLKSLMPVLDEIKNAVEHSTNKIPKASEQLTTVTQATESATIEILNFLDDMGQRIEAIEARLKHFQQELRRDDALRSKVHALLMDLSAPTYKRYAVRHYIDEIRPLLEQPSYSEQVELLCAQLADVRAITMNIAMALQVQDITSQQIDSVRHLIDNVRVQLSNVVGQYNGNEPVMQDKSLAQKAFDSQAVYSHDTSRQADADSIVAQYEQIHLQVKQQ